MGPFKKVFYFLGLCAYVLGVMGSLGYVLAGQAYLIAACLLIVAVFALPTVDYIFYHLIHDGE